MSGVRRLTSERLQRAREVLSCARELITPMERWVQGSAALDRLGRPVAARNPDACCFCAVGAIDRCTRDDVGAYTLSADIVDSCTGSAGSIISLNDGYCWTDPETPRERARRHQRVLGAFDRALGKIDAELQKRKEQADATQ